MNDQFLAQLVETLKKLGEKPVALSVLEALARHSYIFEQYDQLAQCYFKLKMYREAIIYGEKAEITGYTNEKKYLARANLINVYNHANLPEKAMRMIKMNEMMIPDDVDTQLEKAFSLFLLNRKDEAEQVLLKHVDDETLPEETRTKIRFNLGTYKMYRDEFIEGLRLFLFEGRKLDYWKKPKLPYQFWDGEVLPGRTIIIMAEAGIGDEFINVRFMEHFRKLGMHPIWLTERAEIADVFNRNNLLTVTDPKIVSSEQPLLWTHSMDVPVYLNLKYEDLWHGPYLTADKTRQLKTSALTYDLLPKVGIRWQGQPEYDHDLHRSIPLQQIYDVVKDTGYSLFSLQRDFGLDELANLDELKTAPIVDLTPDLQHWEDTLAAIDKLDIVITTCTSIAHAAAAMGKRTFVFVPISAYYVWSHSMKQSPWYGDNVTILRQQKPRDWTEPLNELRNILSNVAQLNTIT